MGSSPIRPTKEMRSLRAGIIRMLVDCSVKISESVARTPTTGSVSQVIGQYRADVYRSACTQLEAVFEGDKRFFSQPIFVLLVN
jgi:hypothetical protein